MVFGKKKRRLAKAPVRKSPTQSSYQRIGNPGLNSKEFGLNYSKPRLNLGGERAVFEGGRWVLEGRSRHRASTPEPRGEEVVAAAEEVRRLEEENCFLRLKVEVMLTLLAELKILEFNNEVKEKRDELGMGDVETKF